PAVRLDDATAHGEPDSAPLHLPLDAREHPADSPRVLAAHAHVRRDHGHDPLLAAVAGGDLDSRRLVAVELERVPDEVLQHPAKLARVRAHPWPLAPPPHAPHPRLR